ncbi:CoA ester lyase [Ancylobacter sp. 6x-1]|uniref:CoA ester lyase n=1 Tax=Ancylobacter crimeensis TaxID=2579147 RepID=A0ABT0DDL9_9HYPH|nr:CoA ester lyase [Ancylobacter crimeensis]MCK0198037.1 CoA ester lyase [Ancylobacter crimeensis]
MPAHTAVWPPVPLRPRRSALFMPGSNPRVIEKAPTLPADCIILDLEDAVAPEQKAQARDRVAAAIRGGGFGYREMVMRLNGPDTPWFEADLAAAAAARPDAVLVPKVSDPELPGLIGRKLAALGAPPTVRLWAMIESPAAVLKAEAIAATARDPASRLSLLMLGTNDLAKETGARIVPGRAPMLPWIAHCVLAARAAGIGIIDAVWNDFRDIEGFAAECAQAADMGFAGKSCIHPGQLAPCNAAFTPPAAEVEEARAVIAVFERPENAGRGVVQMEGRMVERMHADIARQVVALSDAIAAQQED